MTHCEKCICYDICEIHQDEMADEFITFFPNNEDCKHFKNKADYVEVKHGHWIKRGNEKKCSVCAFVYYSNNDEWNGCPNCLAKMDERS